MEPLDKSLSKPKENDEPTEGTALQNKKEQNEEPHEENKLQPIELHTTETQRESSKCAKIGRKRIIIISIVVAVVVILIVAITVPVVLTQGNKDSDVGIKGNCLNGDACLQCSRHQKANMQGIMVCCPNCEIPDGYLYQFYHKDNTMSCYCMCNEECELLRKSQGGK